MPGVSASAAPPHCRVHVAPGAAAWAEGRPALFLDRDGVVVEEVGYLGDPGEVALIPGAGPAVARARAAGLAVLLVTNQSGVGRGYYDWAAFDAVQAEIARRLAAEAPGAHFDAAFACGVDPSGADGADHPWRKPAAGMLLAARDALGVDLARSRIVGDKIDDLAAGRAAGLAGGVLVATGYGGATAGAAVEALRTAAFEVMLAADLRAATDALLARGWPAGSVGADAPC